MKTAQETTIDTELARLPAAAAGALRAAILDAIAQRPDATRGDALAIAHTVWANTRAQRFGATGETIEHTLTIRVPAPISAIQGAVLAALAEGDALVGLKREHQRLTEEIARIELRRRAPAKTGGR
jgi:hypothetical protein